MRFEHYPEQLSLSLIDDLEAVDPQASLTWLGPATTVDRFHVVAACLNARIVGFAAADASDGHVTVHAVVLAPDHRDDDLAAALLAGVIDACHSAWGDVRIPPLTPGVEGLRQRGWIHVESDRPGLDRYSGARAA